MRVNNISFAVLLFIFCFQISFADESVDSIIEADSYLKEIKKQLQNEKNDLKSLAGTKKEIAAKMYEIESTLELQEDAFKAIAAKAKSSSEALNKLQKRLNELENELKILKNGVKDSNIYLLDNIEYVNMKLLLFSKHRNSTVKNLELIELLNTGLISDIKKISEKTEALKIMRDEQEVKTDDLHKLLVLKKRLAKEYQNEKLKLEQMVKIIKEDEDSKKEYINILNRKRRQFEKKLNSITAAKEDNSKNDTTPDSSVKGSFESMKGKFKWPAEGELIEKFGPKTVKGFSGTVVNKGIKIRPNKDGTINTIYGGVVKHKDIIRGFGNILIIQHDKTYYTLYANMDKIHVNTGDKVTAGQKIGTIDVDLVPIPSYLYFEIRKRNTALNPSDWLESRRR